MLFFWEGSGLARMVDLKQCPVGSKQLSTLSRGFSFLGVIVSVVWILVGAKLNMFA
jgi:hypothetical protein